MRVLRHGTLTIPLNGTTSTGYQPTDGVFGMLGLDTMTGTSLTFQIKTGNNSTWRTVKDSSGNTVSITINDDEAVRIPDACFPCSEIRVVSGSSELAERTIQIQVGS